MSPVLSYVSLFARDAADEIQSAPETFSSWDKCMDKTYCKWPVIAGIIVGGVILLSVIACIVNCMCCGIRCCTSCCGCCCPSPKPKQPKYGGDPYHHHQPPPMPYMPPVNNGYQGGYQEGYQGGYQAPQALPTYRGAQIARFDTPSSPGVAKAHEDSLPAMPSWDNAVTRRVEDTSPQPESVEMEPMNHVTRPPHRTPSAPRSNRGDYMGPPPLRTAPQNDYYPDSHGYDEQNPYDYCAQGSLHNHDSPYDQPYNQTYRDHSPGSNYHAMSPPPQTYSPGPHYPVGVAISPTTEMNRPIPYRQPSPGFSQQPPSYRTMSPAMPSSPPPPFTAAATIHEVSDPGRPPSLLQSGRKPVPNSYRDL